MSTNDITGDKLQSKTTTDAYRDGWEAIFGKKKQDAMRLLVETKGLELDLGKCIDHYYKPDENIPCNK